MRCHSSLGHLAYDQGRLQQAEQCQRESLAFVQVAAEPNSWLAGVVLRHLGQATIAFGEDRHAEARNYLRQALALAAERQFAPFALAACVDVAQLQAQGARLHAPPNCWPWSSSTQPVRLRPGRRRVSN